MSEQEKKRYEVRIPRNEILPQVVIMETGNIDKIENEGDIIVYIVPFVPDIIVQTHPGVIVREIK